MGHRRWQWAQFISVEFYITVDFWHGIFHGEASSKRHHRGEEQQGGHSLGKSTQLAAVLAPPLKDFVKTSVRKFDTLIKVCYFAGAASG